MRAFLNDGKGLGFEHSSVTGDYKTLRGLRKFAIEPFQRSHGGMCTAEIYFNWDDRYGKPDRVITYDGKKGVVRNGY